MSARSLKMGGFACMIFCAVIQVGAQTSAPSYVLQPPYAKANQAFTLALKNSKFTCASTFSGQSASVSGGTLNLTFTAGTAIGVGTCVISDTLYGPVFQIPALSVGSYSVQAIQEPACAPLCAIAVRPEFAGTLTVVNPNDSSWFLQPRETVAGKTFTLQLLSYAYGNCQTTFTHDSLTISGGQLVASYVLITNPARACPADIRPYGPSYAAPALPVGKYPVYAASHLACEYTVPVCPVAYRPPVFVDTLNVLAQGTTALLPEAPYVPSSGLRTPVFPDFLGLVHGYWLDGRKTVPASR